MSHIWFSDVGPYGKITKLVYRFGGKPVSNYDAGVKHLRR